MKNSFVIEYLKPIGVFELIEGFIRLRYVENTGAVFGSFASHTAVLTIVSIILLIKNLLLATCVP